MSKNKSATDKNELAKKIEQAKFFLKTKTSSGDKDIDEILKKRAESFAKKNKKTNLQNDSISVLQFILGKENYAIKTEHLKGIIETKQIVELPCTPAFVLGVINIRGNIVTILDLRKILHLNYVGINDVASIIVVDFKDSMVGIVADEIIGIKNIDNSHIQKEKPGTIKIKDEFLEGITNDTIIMLNIVNILADESLLVEESVL